MRAAAEKGDKEFATVCRQIIAGIERATAESVPEAEAKKRATVRKEIREFVADRARGKRD